MLSSKLTVSVHILTILAASPEEALTSEFIAGSVNTNPVVIRRLLGRLRAQGFVESKGGVGGGWSLKINPKQIRLLDVLRAVESQVETFALHRNAPNPRCPVGRHVQGALTDVYSEAQRAMENRLAHATIASILDTVEKRMTS